ncbi:MAG: alpha/beta fold hydrolase [Bacteroidia bacterium]|nr:alpha/beta fold hydrolase [Bacteroidia bacterium]
MELAYREFGSGQPLIILHGLFGQSDNWNTLAKRFAENNFHVFTIDQRNHGLSAHSEEWTYEAMAKDLNEFIIKRRIQQPILLGHSMGGKTVMFFDYLFPNTAYKIIIADIAPKAYEAHHDAVLKALNAVDFSKINQRKDAEEIMGQYITDFGTKQFLLKNIYWKDTDPKQMAWRFNLEVISKEYNNVVVSVPAFQSNTPTLFIRGSKSNYITDNDWIEIQQVFQHALLTTINDSGHWVHAEKPNEFFETVMNFISS